MISDLKGKGIILRVNSCNSPVWPVHKTDGRWRLTVDYRHLNANTCPLTTTVPNTAKLVTTIHEQATILATIDIEDMFFRVLLWEVDREHFAFTWEDKQYSSTHLSQGYHHSPTIHCPLCLSTRACPNYPQGRSQNILVC